MQEVELAQKDMASTLLDFPAQIVDFLFFQEYNSAMTQTDRKTGPRIDIQKAFAKKAESAEIAESILSMLEPEMEANMSLYGRVFMGSSHKLVFDADGIGHAEDWTIEELMERGDEMNADSEKKVRESLDEELSAVEKYQAKFFKDRYFGKNQHLFDESEQVQEYIRELRCEVRNSNAKLAYPWVIDEREERRAAEFLEVIRRTVLKPSYVIMEGVGEGYITSIPSFDDPKSMDELDERRNNSGYVIGGPEKYKDYRARLVQEAMDNPKSYSSEEWREILDKEKTYLFEYLKGRAIRGLRAMFNHIDMSDRLYDGRKKVFKKKDMEKLNEQYTPAFLVPTIVRGVSSLEDLHPSLKATLGEDLTPRQLLMALNIYSSPREQGIF